MIHVSVVIGLSSKFKQKYLEKFLNESSFASNAQVMNKLEKKWN